MMFDQGHERGGELGETFVETQVGTTDFVFESERYMMLSRGDVREDSRAKTILASDN